ncbi:hypothetical protein N7454_011146 [Penicillium verhagenii]|nr:hypothetical protein N7454_011146 [Penicillium verhagenii]
MTDPGKVAAQVEDGSEKYENKRTFDFSSLDEAVGPDDLHALVQEIVKDDIHNNHTTWFTIRTHHCEEFTDALAVLIELCTGFCFYHDFCKHLMPKYFAVQFIGACLAALAAYVLFNDFVGTGILALGDDQNAPPGAIMNALIIGLLITWLCTSFAYQTGAALNPTRDFGPCFALLALGYSGEMLRNVYGPFVGTISGAFGGAFLYDLFITLMEVAAQLPLETNRACDEEEHQKWKRRLRMREEEKRILCFVDIILNNEYFHSNIIGEIRWSVLMIFDGPARSNTTIGE